MSTSLSDLRLRRAELQAIHDYLPHFGINTGSPPIIDSMGATLSSKGPVFPADDAKARSDLLRHTPNSVPGSRIFRDSIKTDIEQMDKFLSRHTTKGTESTSTFSTNAPYLISVWNEIARAQAPVIFIDKSFNAPARTGSSSNLAAKGLSRNSATKIDVIADNGKRWIRVNTTKNSRLLAEFREQDSYLTESEDEDDSNCISNSAQELDNSLLRMGKSLLEAAQRSPVDDINYSVTIPKVTLRLTRLLLDADSLGKLQDLGLTIVGSPEILPPDSREFDDRITQTLKELLRLGIDIVLGEYEFSAPPAPSLSAPGKLHIIPSRNVNLDLSVLIALISDLTHATLPATVAEARTRFIPSPSERERSKRRRQRQKELQAQVSAQRASTSKSEKDGLNPHKLDRIVAERNLVINTDRNKQSKESENGESTHSKALASQALREMENGLLDELAERFSSEKAKMPGCFWASREVRDRFLRIVAKIGGPAERRRAGALLSCIGKGSGTLTDADAEVETAIKTHYDSLEEAEAAFWEGSRHPQGKVPGLVPIHIIEDDNVESKIIHGAADKREILVPVAGNAFWAALGAACRRLLASGTVAHPHAVLVSAAKVANGAGAAPSSTPDADIESDGSDVGSKDDPGSSSDGGADLGEIVRAAVTRANPRLTAHTVATLARGATMRWTTLTANRAAVREMMHESAKETFAGTCSTPASITAPSNSVNGKDQHHVDGLAPPTGGGSCEEKVEPAAVWVVEPRSLAETMRGDYRPAN